MADLKYSVDIDTSSGIQKLRALRQELGKTQAGLGKLSKSTNNIGGTKALGNISALKAGIAGLVGAISVRAIVNFGNEIVNTTAKMEAHTNKLRLLTSSTEELNRVQALLQQTAVATRSSYADTVDLFSKLRISTEQLGKSEEQVLQVTTKLSQALQVAGADTATSSAVIRQFGQAMASGTVRGDEFRSIVEGMGPALAIMARESGLNVGELRRMSQAGELTAEVMFDMIQNSTALSTAFNDMKPTISNLKKAFVDSWDRMLIKVGEVTGATEAYKSTLEKLTRFMDKFSEASGAIVNMDTNELWAQYQEGALSAVATLEEVRKRQYELARANLSNKPGQRDFAESQALKLMAKRLVEKAEAEKLDAEETKKAIAAIKEKNEALAAALEPFKGLVAESEKYAKLDFSTPMEKLIAKRDAAAETITKIKDAIAELQRTSGNSEAIDTLSASLDHAQKAWRGFNNEIENSTAIESYSEWANSFETSMRTTARNMTYARQAFADLTAAKLAGTVTDEEYNIRAERLNQILGNTTEKVGNTIDVISQFKRAMDASTTGKMVEGYRADMDELQLLISENVEQINQKMLTAREKLEAQRNSGNSGEIDAQILELVKLSEAAMEEQRKIIEANYKAQRTFAYGWKTAFREYVEQASNSASQAAKVFKTATQGMEDAIVNFVKTGKFEFKDLASTILEELLRIQIQKTMAGIMGGSSGSGIGSLFSGFFATGGMIPAGRYGVVGEAGPELVTGPANVTPTDKLGGSTSVTYNINAVDAASFKELVARDPGFMFAVSEQGRKRINGGR